MGVVERAREAVRGKGLRVVMPEVEDDRIRTAAARIAAEGIATPVPVGEGDVEPYVPLVLAARPGLKPALAARMLQKPLFRAAAMVAAGEAEALIAGAATPTRRVIEAAMLTIGLAEGVSLPSSFFLMAFRDGREMVFADCAVNVDPDAAGLAAIATASARSAERLLGSARLAMLSYATLASGQGPSVDRVRAATEAVQAAGIDAIGPVQADAALNPEIATRKGIDAAEPANVLVFPDLDAGNIAYKLAQELAGAQAVGPFLQGFARPVCDLSRGARVDDIVAATAVTLAVG